MTKKHDKFIPIPVQYNGLELSPRHDICQTDITFRFDKMLELASKFSTKFKKTRISQAGIAQIKERLIRQILSNSGCLVVEMPEYDFVFYIHKLSNLNVKCNCHKQKTINIYKDELSKLK